MFLPQIRVDITRHAKERWDRRIRRSSLEDLVQSLRASNLTSRQLHADVKAWMYRKNARLDPQTVLFHNPTDGAIFLTKASAPGAFVVVTVFAQREIQHVASRGRRNKEPAAL